MGKSHIVIMVLSQMKTLSFDQPLQLWGQPQLAIANSSTKLFRYFSKNFQRIKYILFIFSDNIFANSFIRKVQTEYSNTRPPNVGSACIVTRSSLDASLPSTPTASPAHQSSCTTTVLALVMHAGSILDSGLESTANKKTDVHTFASSFDAVIRQHYPALTGHLSVRLVECTSVCSDALAVLSK